MNSPKKIAEALQANFFQVMNDLNKQQLEAVTQYLADVYFNDGVSLVSDENFDRLKETYIKKFGQTEAMKAVGAEVVKEKVKLPYYLGSMDKIKPDRNNLESWKKTYPDRKSVV